MNSTKTNALDGTVQHFIENINEVTPKSWTD